MTDNRRNTNGRKRTDKHSRRLGIALLLTLGACLCIYFAGCSSFSRSTSLRDLISGLTDAGTGASRQTATGRAMAYTPFLDTGYAVVQMTEDDLAEGDLVLVNRDNLWSFPQDGSLTSIYDGKTGSYYVKDMNVLLDSGALEHLNAMMDDFKAATGYTDVNVVSGYRSYADQEGLYNDSIAVNGQEHTSRYTAMPGCSEHHTGLAVDFALFYDDTGLSGSFEGSEESRWILENCWKYGFVKRYAAEKESYTGVADEPWHFRYVGLPHAYYMTQNGLCLEEYLELLRGYSWNGGHLRIDVPEAGSYEVYFCSGTKLHVPETGEYTVSGNNSDGFIVSYCS